MTVRRLALAVLVALAGLGCRQDMHDQPKYKPYRASDFFADGRAMRPLVKGTVPRGTLREDERLYTGMLEDDARLLRTAQRTARPSDGRSSAHGRVP